MLSMNLVWDDTVAFIRRERALLWPLALATIFIGDIAVALAGGGVQPGKVALGAALLFIVAALWSMLGQLAIIALVLHPGRSVGEALRHGAARLGKVVLIALLIGLVAAVTMMPFLAGLVANGIDPAKPESMAQLPGWASLVMLVYLGGLLWIGVRLAMLNALIVDRNPGVLVAIRQAFGLTRGIVSRLALVFGVYLIVLVTMSSAVRFVLGSVFALLGAALGAPFVGEVLTAIGTGLVTTALSAVAAIFLAVLYRRVTSGT
ncbi:MAG: hypothetical protein ACKVOP_02365 [Sphingomonadaceae bacterium]